MIMNVYYHVITIGSSIIIHKRFVWDKMIVVQLNYLIKLLLCIIMKIIINVLYNVITIGIIILNKKNFASKKILVLMYLIINNN